MSLFQQDSYWWCNNSCNISATSDVRAKENVEPIDQPLEIIKEIKGATFNMKEDEKKKKRIKYVQELETITRSVSEDSSGTKQIIRI